MAEFADDCASPKPRPLMPWVKHCAIIATIGMGLFCLSGCAHYFYLTAGDFSRGQASDIQFRRDSSQCAVTASVRQNQVGGGDPHGVYNETYTACMTKHGYIANNIDLLGIGG